MPRLLKILVLVVATAVAFLPPAVGRAGHDRRRSSCGVACAHMAHTVAAVPQAAYAAPAAAGNSLSITNYYQFSAPAAQQGTTSYGYSAYGLDYGALDLAGLLSQYARLAEQGQQGQLTVAASLGGLLAGASNLESQRLRVAETLAIGQAAAAVASSVKSEVRETVAETVGQLQAQVTLSTAAAGAADWKPGVEGLVAKNCVQCHSEGGAGVATYRLDGPLSAGDRLRAIGALLHDDPARRMPKGQEIDQQTRGLLIQELAAPAAE